MFFHLFVFLSFCLVLKRPLGFQILKWQWFLKVLYRFLKVIYRLLKVIHRFLKVVSTRGRYRAARAAKNIKAALPEELMMSS